MTDVVSQMGIAFLGTRLKRLGERMQAGAAAVIADAGLPIQPGHMGVLAALRDGPLPVGQLADRLGTSQPGVTRTVGQLVKLGMVEATAGADLRERRIALTPSGKAAARRAENDIWPRVGRAAESLFAHGEAEAFLAQLDRLEAGLAKATIAARAAPRLSLVEYDDSLARDFHDINAEWIEAMFRLEQTDREVLENPRERIIEPGGAILFVAAEGLGIVGACALQKTGASGFELTKMGVRETARGLKAGEFLLDAVIDRAGSMGADPLYLLTNRKCAAAIHLYEKLGFAHDAGIMAAYGTRYERCDVAMRYRG
ncbi:DNA-binding MarR family transcriptional regulator [Novosphingobium kunmingense]|uniref:DNA-binding MarR family transcriptional regulator n=1 Tax=Novosphingobium kunmingense TaxID=1211806 RepID=A0A2N0I1C3_9SPHN|nr:bifunctional helix-turn-helix transcriptional regulator/GNAT family N-acetyltransferase [Novosphingobium kunmingense]PKB24982.1 DNA-binding MarR family transcriptional regulator [Novosphingobium kunmingense]